MKKIISILCISFLAGCASVMNDSTHSMKIDVKNSTGEKLNDAQCSLDNSHGKVECVSGNSVRVHRDSSDLTIVCSTKDGRRADGKAISRANGGLAGNILFGGVVGAVIDHNKGTAYTYPTWVELEVGKTLTFDRSDEEEGKPVVGK